jgi:hypothetical protein
MNPGIFMLLTWEKRLEIQRQDQWEQECNLEDFLFKAPKPRSKINWISRFFKRSLQPSCKCSQAV